MLTARVGKVKKVSGIGLLVVMAVLVVLPGCSKSKLVTSWMNESLTGYQLKKALVIAVFKDPVTQKIFENSFVSLLENAGVQAVAGNTYNLVGPDQPRQAAIESAIEKSGAGSVFLIHILSITTKTYNDPPMDDYVVYGGYWDSLTGYHNYIFHQVWSPGSTVEKRYERMEVTLFDTAGGKPVWSARSESVNLEDRLKKDDEQLERVFLADLRQKKIL